MRGVHDGQAGQIPTKGRIYDCNDSDSSENYLGLMLREESIYALLGRRFNIDVPSGKQNNGWMTLESARQDLGSLHTELYALVLNRRNR